MNRTCHIIIVEENESDYELMIAALKKSRCRFEARRVDSQEELDEEFHQLAPDFVLCSHLGSKSNTSAVLEQVRAFQSNMPFVVLSTELDEVTHANLLASGVDACVDKKSLEELAPCLRKVLGRHIEQERLCVEKIRRNIIPLVSSRRRSLRPTLQAQTG